MAFAEKSHEEQEAQKQTGDGDESLQNMNLVFG